MLRYKAYLNTGGTEDPFKPGSLMRMRTLSMCSGTSSLLERGDMATGGAANLVNPLVDKGGGMSCVWRYFGIVADDEANINDNQKPNQKTCHQGFLSKEETHLT